MVLEFLFYEDASNFDSNSGSDVAPDSYDGYDSDLNCLRFTFKELVLKTVVVVEPWGGGVVDTVVDIETIVGIGLPPHTNTNSMMEEPWETDIMEHWLLRHSSLVNDGLGKKMDEDEEGVGGIETQIDHRRNFI